MNWFSWLKRPPDFVIGRDYLRRWYLISRNRWFCIYLHNIQRSDDDRALHDHPWWNVSIILKGEYWEETSNGLSYWPRWSVIFRRAITRHRLIVMDNSDVWTLFIRGRKIRTWGFWCPKGFVPWYDFVDMSNTGEIGPGCGD